MSEHAPKNVTVNNPFSGDLAPQKGSAFEESQTAVTLCNMFNKDSLALHKPLKHPHRPYTQWQVLTGRCLCALWDTVKK